MRFRRLALALLPLAVASSRLPAQQLDALLAADRALSTLGLTEAIQRGGATDVTLLYPGAPVVRGQVAAKLLLDAQPALRAIQLRWLPLFGEVSSDGNFGVTWGVTAITDSAGTPGAAVRFGKYLSAWRRDGDTWKLVAHAQVGLLPASAVVLPPGWVAPAVPDMPAGAAADFAHADNEFAALAGREGAASAFATWVDPEGTVFPGSGELVRGTEAVRQLFAGGTASWAWHPVVAMAASSGDLGFTVGEATITPRGGVPSSTKYLTLWKRRANGAIGFVADGGNARPAR